MPSKKAIELAMVHDYGKNWKTEYQDDLFEYIKKYQPDDYNDVLALATLIDEAVKPLLDALKECAKGVCVTDGHGRELSEYICPSCRGVANKHYHDCAIMVALRGWEATDEK